MYKPARNSQTFTVTSWKTKLSAKFSLQFYSYLASGNIGRAVNKQKTVWFMCKIKRLGLSRYN